MMSIFPKMKKVTMLVLALFFTMAAWAQKANITGKVVDKDGVGIPSVTISNNGTVIGITDGQGNFRVSADKNASLTFSSVGYIAKTESLDGKSSIEVTLVTKANTNSGEVTVIGYGTAKRGDLTGSVTKVSPKDFNKGPAQTVDQLIQGRVAGLVITRAGNDPNGGSNIQLRGPGTLLGNTQPLYVIDGVPGADPSLVAPDDIASVDVLKDASATAIYGTRAANGVILLTTKRGKTGQMSVSYSGVVGFEKISNKIEMADASDIRKAWVDFGLGNQSANDDGANTDWQDVITRSGLTHNHNISFSGGTAGAKYIASVNYFNQQGILVNSDINRITGRVGTDFSGFDNKVRLSLNLLNNFSNNSFVDYGTESNSPYYQALRFLPTMNVKNADGSYRNVAGRFNYYNPLQMIERYSNKKKGSSFQGNARLGIDLSSWLTYDVLLTYLKDDGFGNQFLQDDAPQLTSGRTLWQARKYFSKSNAQILENYFSAKKKFGNLNTKFLVGYSWEKRTQEGSAFKAPNALNPAVLGSNLGSSFYVPDGYQIIDGSGSSSRKLISFYGRGELNYMSKYLLNFTVRRDGSTVFGKNNKWASFPSVAFAWKLTEETFLKNNKIFSDLKLRVGYGSSGEQGVAPYQSQRSFSTGVNFYSNGNFVSALTPSRNENPDLKWQTTNMLNLGLDWGILNNKITGTIEVYNKDSRDLLFDYTVNVPPFPYGTIADNAGRVNNKGIELSVSSQNVAKKNFTWSTSFNIAFNKNEIIDIASEKYTIGDDPIRYVGGVPGQGLSGENITKLKKGIPLGTFFLYKHLGHDQYGNNYFQDKNGNAVLSSQLNGLTDQDDSYGSAIPKATMGLSNTFTYKKLDFSVFLRGAFGHKIMNGIALNLDRPLEINQINVSKRALEYKSGDQPRPSTKYLEDGDFVRIDNVSIGYNIGNIPALKYVKSARLFINIQNLATFTKYTGIDPELNLGGLAPGLDMGIYPRTRTISVGLNINL
jgi:TonB-dependent starch-binding outer membrane protein SusC